MDRELLQDARLLGLVAAGHREAFAELFRRRQRDVYRFAMHMTASPSMSEDVTQEVFLAVMRDAARYEPGKASVLAWLCGIARNQVRRRLERDRQLLTLGDDESILDEQVVDCDPLGDLTNAERLEALRQAVLTLPIRYREAVVLCDLQELSYAEAADALGCAVGTVRSRLHRGRALLTLKLTAADPVSREREADAGESEPSSARTIARAPATADSRLRNRRGDGPGFEPAVNRT